MPTYEYHCVECEVGVDVQHPIAELETHIEMCPECGCPMVRALAAPAGWVPGSSTPCKG